MMRLHREQERERESAGLERYAAEVARNPPTMSAESRAMSMAAAAAASRTPGCRHMAEKVMIKCMAAKVPAAAAPAAAPAAAGEVGVKVARWKGRCPACERPISPGVDICRSEDPKGWIHATCRAAPAAPAARPGDCASNPIVVGSGRPGDCASNPIVVGSARPGDCASNPIVVGSVPAADRQPTTLRERREVVRQRKLDDPYYSDSDPESDGYSVSDEETDPEWCMGEGFDEELYDWEDRHLFNQ